MTTVHFLVDESTRTGESLLSGIEVVDNRGDSCATVDVLPIREEVPSCASAGCDTERVEYDDGEGETEGELPSP